MLAKLMAHPLRRSLASYGTRELHNFHFDISRVAAKNRLEIEINTINVAGKGGSASNNEVDILMEHLFQRAVPVPHANTDGAVGGESSFVGLRYAPLQAAVYDPLQSDMKRYRS